MNPKWLSVFEHANGTCEVRTHTPKGMACVAKDLTCGREAILAAFHGWTPPVRRPSATAQRKAAILQRLTEAGLL